MFLNLLFLITSLPIVTIGASWTALLASVAKVWSGTEQEVFLNYFRRFKENFKQGTSIWFIFFFLGFFFFLDFQLIFRQEELFLGMLLPLGIAVFLLSLIGIYSFPMIGRYQLNNKQVLKNCFGLLSQHSLITLILIFSNFGIFWLSISSPERLLTAIYFYTFGGVSIVALFNYWLLHPIYQCLEQNKKRKI